MCRRQVLECARLQRIAGEDGGGFVEGDVHGGLAAAQVVVVHRRQVVVHQRIGVDQFHRDGGRMQRGFVRLQQRAAGIDEQGTHALAASQDGVAHGGMQALRCPVGRRQCPLQMVFQSRRPVGEAGISGHRAQARRARRSRAVPGR